MRRMRDGHWNAGDPVLLREVYQRRVWAARPAVVVEDNDRLAAFYLPPGRWRVVRLSTHV